MERRLDMPQGMAGYWRPFTDTITLNAFDSHDDQTIALAHELAHRHDPDLRAALIAGDPRYYGHDRPDCEAVAEAAVHTIAALYGFDTAATAGHDIAAWVGRRRRPAHRPGRPRRQASSTPSAHPTAPAGVAAGRGSKMRAPAAAASKSNGQVKVDIGGVAGEAARRHARQAALPAEGAHRRLPPLRGHRGAGHRARPVAATGVAMTDAQRAGLRRFRTQRSTHPGDAATSSARRLLADVDVDAQPRLEASTHQSPPGHQVRRKAARHDRPGPTTSATCRTRPKI